MSEAISPAESVRLIELERIIDRGKTTFVEVGNALREIRESRLYRISHTTFEDYFRDRLGLEKSHVKRLMDAAIIVDNLKTSPTGEVPQNEHQIRPLTKLPAEQQPVAWEKAVEKAAEEGKPVAARHVEEAVKEVAPSASPKARPINYEPEDGLNIWAAAKSVLDRILPNDKQRLDALSKAQEYIQARLNENR